MAPRFSCIALLATVLGLAAGLAPRPSKPAHAKNRVHRAENAAAIADFLSP